MLSYLATISDRVIHVDELVADTEFLSNMLPQCLHAVSLGSMMPGRNKGHTGFAREMHGPLGNFAGDKCIHPKPNSVLEIILRGAGTPRDLSHSLLIVTDYQRFTSEGVFDIQAQFFQIRNRRQNGSVHAYILVAKATSFD